MVCGVSVGSRQTRKERRTRRRRAELRGSASAVLRRSARTGRDTLREWASTVLGALIAVVWAGGRAAAGGVRESSRTGRNALGRSLRAGRDLLIATARALSRGSVRDLLLFVALLGSSVAGVASVFADEIELAASFCFLALVLCAVLWVRGAS